MNGLRVAAKAWNLKCNCGEEGWVEAMPNRTFVFEGTVRGKRFLMLCYVDD